MNLLLLGGPRFVGRLLIESALERGHQVTTFNRGKTNPDAYPQITKLHGDRTQSLDALLDSSWDAVIDTSGYVPRHVRASAQALASRAGQYTFISTIATYASPAPSHIDERTPLGELADPTVEEITHETYGPLKVLCERAVEEAFPSRSLIIRPGLIVGPHDNTDRFTYWPVRIQRGGDVLVPSTPDFPMQIIDVRDLAAWTIRMIEAGQTGIYNATGPANPVTFGEVIEQCLAHAPADTQITWVEEQFLLTQGVKPWSDLPLWIPTTDEDVARLSKIDVRKAIAAGLTFRPLAETIADTLAWNATRPDGYQWRAGLSAEREQELLARFRAA